MKFDIDRFTWLAKKRLNNLNLFDKDLFDTIASIINEMRTELIKKSNIDLKPGYYYRDVEGDIFYCSGIDPSSESNHPSMLCLPMLRDSDNKIRSFRPVWFYKNGCCMADGNVTRASIAEEIGMEISPDMIRNS